MTCLVDVWPGSPVAGFAGGLVVEELLVSAAHTAPAALAPVLPYITLQYITV